ncbi:MAG TPA: hypothetical protein VF144_10565 [Chitinophagaceae bacterium]
MSILIKIFSSKAATSLCLITAILCRVINVFFVSYAGRDKMFLVSQCKSLLQGNGLSVPQYFTHNLETPAYDFTPLWPPGYPILLAPFLKIFNYNIYWATTSFDILVCIGLIFIVRKLCRQIGMPQAGVNIMTLIAGCFEYTFINESLPTDTVSLVLFLVGLSLTIQLLSLNRMHTGMVIMASLFLFLPCLFRYNYPAISLSIIVVVLIIGFINKDALLKKKGLALFLITAGLTATFFIIMKIGTGYAGYTTPTERGFFPENIVNWFPVFPSSYINLAFLTSQGIRITQVSFEKQMLILEGINVICILSLAIFFIWLFFRKNFIRSLTPFNWFLVLSFAACVILFGVLGYVSLTHAVQKGVLNDWNYIYEPRYFAFAYIFLQIAFIGWIFLFPKPKNSFLKGLIWSLCFLLFVEVSHNIYFNTKIAFNFKKYKSAVYREQDYSYFFSLIDSLEKKYPREEIWVSGPGDNFYYYTATYLGHKGIADATNLKNDFPAPKRKTIFVFVLYDHEIATYQDVLTRSKALLSGRAGTTNFYVAEFAA